MRDEREKRCLKNECKEAMGRNKVIERKLKGLQKGRKLKGLPKRMKLKVLTWRLKENMSPRWEVVSEDAMKLKNIINK